MGKYEASFERLCDHRLLTREEEQKLAKQLRSRRPAARTKARKKLVRLNLRLVRNIARGYARKVALARGCNEHSSFFLNLAAEKFDWRRRLRFSTYATW